MLYISKTGISSLQWDLESSISKLESDVRELKRVNPEIKIMTLESEVQRLKSLSSEFLQISNLESDVRKLKRHLFDVRMDAKWVYLDGFSRGRLYSTLAEFH
jgi:hypothetical protein